MPRGGPAGEVVGTVLHEQVIVLDANRPVRGEGVFEAGADRAAPAGVVAGDASERAAYNVVDAVAVRGHRSTALDVEQDVVDGITDLTGEQAERIDVGVVTEARGTPGSRCCPRSRPSCPGLQDRTPRCQPASDSRPGHRPCRRSRHGNPRGRPKRRPTIPGVAARTPAAVRTDVETGPVIHSSDHRGRLGVRTRSEIRSNSRRSRAERDQTGRNKQNLLHSFYSRSVLTAPKAVACS